mgnify:CR=1 FL=1
MANRERKNELKIYLSDKEQYILEQKVKISGMKSKSTFLRRLILYGFVYDIDYSDLREYNYTLGDFTQSSILLWGLFVQKNSEKNQKSWQEIL